MIEIVDGLGGKKYIYFLIMDVFDIFEEELFFFYKNGFNKI